MDLDLKNKKVNRTFILKNNKERTHISNMKYNYNITIFYNEFKLWRYSLG